MGAEGARADTTQVEDDRPPAVGDLGDGRPSVVLIDDEVAAFDAPDGRTKWTWQWPDRDKTRRGQGISGPIYDVSPSPVLADLDGDGHLSVCLVVAGRLFVLDGKGQLRREAPLPGISRYWQSRHPTTLWACDLEGHGKAELLCVTRKRAEFGPLAQKRPPCAS